MILTVLMILYAVVSVVILEVAVPRKEPISSGLMIGILVASAFMGIVLGFGLWKFLF